MRSKSSVSVSGAARGAAGSGVSVGFLVAVVVVAVVVVEVVVVGGPTLASSGGGGGGATAPPSLPPPPPDSFMRAMTSVTLENSLRLILPGF